MSPSQTSILSSLRLFRGLRVRQSARTEYPATRNDRTSADPIKPVAPVTMTSPSVIVASMVGNDPSIDQRKTDRGAGLPDVARLQRQIEHDGRIRCGARVHDGTAALIERPDHCRGEARAAVHETQV